MGRFLNADAYASTGLGVIGYNMFAYCQNNPLVLSDVSGDFPIAIRLLSDWVFGDGSSEHYDDDSYIALRMKTSKILKSKIEEEIRKYENGDDYGVGSVHFTAKETDLWLAVRRASYEMTISTETREVGFWNTKQVQTRYIVQIKVYDTYNFNSGNESGDGIGSWLNNLAYHAHEYGMGKDFYFEVNFTYETQWK